MPPAACYESASTDSFFSGAALEGDKEKGIEAGANAYVIKPDLAGLFSSIKRLASHPTRTKAKIIPFKRKSPSLFTFGPAAA